MKKPFRRLLAGLTLATAAATGSLAATDTIATPQGDTAWGAPDITELPVTAPGDGPVVNPLDTAWG